MYGGEIVRGGKCPTQNLRGSVLGETVLGKVSEGKLSRGKLFVPPSETHAGRDIKILGTRGQSVNGRVSNLVHLNVVVGVRLEASNPLIGVDRADEYGVAILVDVTG